MFAFVRAVGRAPSRLPPVAVAGRSTALRWLGTFMAASAKNSTAPGLAVAPRLLLRSYWAAAVGESSTSMPNDSGTTAVNHSEPTNTTIETAGDGKSTVTITITVPRTRTAADTTPTDPIYGTTTSPSTDHTATTTALVTEFATKTSIDVLREGMKRMESASEQMKGELRALEELIGQGHTPLAMQMIMESIRPILTNSAPTHIQWPGARHNYIWPNDEIVRCGTAVEFIHLERVVAKYQNKERITNTAASKMFTIENVRHQLVATTTPGSESEPNRRLYLGLYSDMPEDWRNRLSCKNNILTMTRVEVLKDTYHNGPLVDCGRHILTFEPAEIDTYYVPVLPVRYNGLEYMGHAELEQDDVAALERMFYYRNRGRCPSALWAYWGEDTEAGRDHA